MSGSIFLIRGDALVELHATGYANESVLQELIARFPNLLAGDESSLAATRRWLLVGRERGLPDQEDGAARWAVDHLLLDQDAIPTIVEVKLAHDTRIRREVVGQMLDYAANAVVYWPIERLRETFTRDCHAADRDPAALVAETAGEDADVDAFWQRAEENLRAGKLRLVFVADEIPRELRRVIEFLNGQMLAEVIGLEVKQYTAEGVTTLVPSLVGQTAEAETRKGHPPSRQWNAEAFFRALAGRQPAAEVAAARALYDWTLTHGWTASFGRGAEYGSWAPVLTSNGSDYRPLTLYTTGSIAIPFQTLASRPPFDNRDTRRQLMDRLNEIAGVTISADSIDRYPSFRLSTISGHDGALDQLTQTLTWFVEVAG
jgi:hypothetical protein